MYSKSVHYTRRKSFHIYRMKYAVSVSKQIIANGMTIGIQYIHIIDQIDNRYIIDIEPIPRLYI
jgi:RNase P subunit RPR2